MKYYITPIIIIFLLVSSSFIGVSSSSQNLILVSEEIEQTLTNNDSELIAEYTWSVMRYDHVSESENFGVVKMPKPTQFKSRIWLVDEDNIDTDMIFHNRHLHITKLEEMRPYAFGNLEGWQDFPQKAKQNDLLIVGGNFGAGSSRQQAVACFTALGIPLIIGESFGAIYKRNAINAGMALIECPGITDSGLESGDEGPLSD